MDLQEAVRTRKETATIQGKEFFLTYHGNNQVYYRPADDSFAPAGYLDIKRFLGG
jgi:hypothetical protein